LSSHGHNEPWIQKYPYVLPSKLMMIWMVLE
jgi:hypothetical protein